MAPEKSKARHIHVVLVSGAYPPARCGVGDYTARLARALARAGARVSVVTSAMAEEPAPLSGVAVRAVVASWGAAHTPKLGQVLKKLQPDCVLVMYPASGYARGLAPNLILPWLALNLPACGRALILHEYAMYSWLGRRRLAPALAAAQGVVCTNHLDRRALRRQQRTAGRVRVIPLGSAVAPAGAAKPAAFRAGPCVHFGTVMPNKGWENLLRAWQRLRQDQAGLRLEAIGALEPGRYNYHARVAQALADRNLAEDIRFTGYLPAHGVRAAFNKSRGVAVMPFAGGAKLNRSSLVAALSAGLAVVTTRPPHPLEGLRHGTHVWLVEPDDPEALAAGIRRVAGDARLRRRLQAGARLAARRFAWPRIARQVLALVREVAA